jgi:hypothetical protein
LITALLALAALGSAIAYADLTGGRLAPVSLGLGSLGLALLAVAIVLRWPTLVPWAILVSACGYVAGRVGSDVVDGWAALGGVLLLLTAELAIWSIEHDARIRAERSLTLRRITTLAILGGAALLMNFLLLGTAAISASASVVLAAVGVAAAVGALIVVLRLTRARDVS